MGVKLKLKYINIRKFVKYVPVCAVLVGLPTFHIPKKKKKSPGILRSSVMLRAQTDLMSVGRSGPDSKAGWLNNKSSLLIM